jgi:hypothetical protein
MIRVKSRKITRPLFTKESQLKKTLFLLLLCITKNILCAPEKSIILESSVIKLADGIFITADTIEFTRKYRLKLLEFLLGELLANGLRKGKYILLGKLHSIESLAKIEQSIKNSTKPGDIIIQAALQELLTRAKADFIVQSNAFIESGRGSKNITTILIEEDCLKRNRPDSLLLEWSKTKEGQESTMFEKQITSFGLYYHFLTDLVNFLLDLTHSCPKAESQLRDRVAKWSAVKEILPQILKKAHVKNEHINEIEFLKYLKERYFDSLSLDEITPKVIVPLLTEYVKHTHGRN